MPWLVLVGTRAAFFDPSPIITQVQLLPGRWHTDPPPDPLPSDVLYHFWYLPTASAGTLAEISKARRVDAVIVAPESLPKDVKAAIKVRIGTGTNNVEVNEGEVCLNTPGINADATAEWTFRSLLWAYGGASPESISDRTARKELYSGSDTFGASLFNHELTHRTIALLGGGNIAQEVASLCKARHMSVRVWSSAKEGDAMTADMISSKIEEVLDGAEIVSVHVPLVAEGARSTSGLLNEARLRLLKRGAVVINFARPQLVEVNALLRLMLEGHISKAVIDGDLFSGKEGESGPLLPFVDMLRCHIAALGNRLLTLPHVGGDTSDEARVRGMAQAVVQVHAALSRSRLYNLVRPVPPPAALVCSAPPSAQMPEHIGAVSLSLVRKALSSGGKADIALLELGSIINHRNLIGKEGEGMDDAMLRRLLKTLRTLTEELPLERRIEG